VTPGRHATSRFKAAPRGEKATVSPWPDDRQMLLLEAALSDDDAAAAEAWERWRRQGALDDVDYASYRLLARVFRNLGRLGLSDPELARLRGVYRHTWYSNQRLLHAGGRALEALAGAGVDTAVFKGAAIAAQRPEEIGVRLMEDLDVLVRPDHVPAALEVLGRQGWARRDHRPIATLVRITSGTALVGPGGCELDLHWSVLDPPTAEEELWRRAAPVHLGDVPTLVPCPADQLLVTCAHGLSWCPAPLRWVVDAVVIAGGNGVDWAYLADRSRARGPGVVLAVADALRFLRTAMGVAVPAGLDADLGTRAVSPLDRLVHAVKTAPTRGRARQWARQAVCTWDRSRYLEPLLGGPGHSRPARWGRPLGYVRVAAGLDSRSEAALWLARQVATGQMAKLMRYGLGAGTPAPPRARP
jgi:hypothetical protein